MHSHANYAILFTMLVRPRSGWQCRSSQFDVQAMDPRKQSFADQRIRQSGIGALSYGSPSGPSCNAPTAVSNRNVNSVVSRFCCSRRLAFGSTVEAVIRRARCPVVTVGPNALSVTCEFSSRVVYATSFAAASLQALSYALTMTRGEQAQLTLLHVVKRHSAEESASRQDDACKQELFGLISDDRRVPCTPEIMVEHDMGGETIVRISWLRQANVIVMGAHVARILPTYRRPPCTASSASSAMHPVQF